MDLPWRPLSRALPALAAALLLAGCGALRMPGGGEAPDRGASLPTPPSSRPATPRAEPAPKVQTPPAPSAQGDAPEPASPAPEPDAQVDAPEIETGLASWYGKPFHGRRTASGEVYDMNAMSAAHKTMPLPSFALVRNPANGREVVVRVNDRGPFKPGRIIDLSRAAARLLGIAGLAKVEVRRLTIHETRSGALKLPGAPLADARDGGGR
jgi:rare lipoprotein A